MMMIRARARDSTRPDAGYRDSGYLRPVHMLPVSESVAVPSLSLT